MAASIPPVFEEVEGEMIARLEGTPDGVRLFTPEQAARRKGKDASHWQKVWEATMGRYAALLDAQTQPMFVQDAPAAPATPQAPAAPGPVASEDTAAQAPRLNEAPRLALRRYTPTQLVALDAARHRLPVELSDDEWALYLELHHQRGLNPLLRLLIPERRYDANRRAEVLDFVVSYHVYTLIAARTGEMAGEDPVQYCGQDGQWVDVWTADEPPHAARAAVYRKGSDRPFYGTAYWDFYAPYTIGDRGERLLPEFWSKDRGAFMLQKCAHVLALRKAFPEDLGGLHTVEEMMQARAEGQRALRRQDADPDPDEIADRRAEALDHATPDWMRDWDAVPETYNAFQLALVEMGVKSPHREKAKATYVERHPRAEYESPKHLYRAILMDVRRSPGAYGMPAGKREPVLV